MKVLKMLILLSLLTYLSAQNLTGVRICIDPGHGGHDPANDRFVATTGLWESETNLSKAFWLQELLLERGAWVILTRYGNDDQDDISLSQRAAIANNNNVDIFQSIHSNGFDGTENYSLMLFRGYDNGPVFPEAKEIGLIQAFNLYTFNRTTYHTTRGDWDFYDWGTQGLGVLRTLAMPGTLSEGSFHDYIPESWRLLNTDYRKHESHSFLKSFLQFFNAGEVQTGRIAGILRDPTETVTYYYISSTNDSKKPLNNFTVSLNGGEKVFNGDALNNGFFIFDKLEPGVYEIIVNAEFYIPDTFTVNVSANSTTFNDRYLTLVPDYSIPEVVTTSPYNGEQSVGLGDSIFVNFNVRMDKGSTQASISIVPNLQGVVRWFNDNKSFVIDPNTSLQPGTEYHVTIGQYAKSFWNVLIAEPYTFSFTSRANLRLINSYPSDNSQLISTTAKVIVEFDAPLNQSSMATNVTFTDSEGAPVNVFLDFNALNEGKLIFEPTIELPAFSEYKLNLFSGLKDNYYLTLGYDTTIVFYTGPNEFLEGTVLDDFETTSNWLDPDASDSTVHSFATQTGIFSDSKKKFGNKSLKLNYRFTASGGKIFMKSPEGILIPNNNEKLGVYVFGDYSKNHLIFNFRDGDNYVKIYLDTLDWTGYTLKTINLSQYNLTSPKLESIEIDYAEGGNISGTLYFDNLTNGATITGKDDYVSTQLNFELLQNYPNPFNPSTTIRFSIPDAGNVKLTVFDILGRKSKILLDEELDKGNHFIDFKAEDLASGIYFYELKSGKYREVRKMLLVK